MAQSRVEDQVGRVLGDRYELGTLLGSGASGFVFLAEDARLGRKVAVKLLQTGLASDNAFLRRFRAEARAAAAMSHPHIMGVLDWGEEEDGPFLVLEYLRGGSLRDLLDGGHRLSVGQAVRVGMEAATALDYAHRRGVVHRDIKPANLLFDEEGRLSIADFGLARALAEAAWTEPLGSLIGTVRYSSPEAAQGRTVDGRADVYALGLVLIEALSGTAPFASDTALSSLMARVSASPEIPQAAGALGPILADMTRVDPGERPDSQAVLASLESLAAGLTRPEPLPVRRAGPEADPTEPLGVSGRREPEPAGRRRWWLALLVLVVIAGAVLGAKALLAPPSYHLPALSGLTPGEAALKLRADGFRLVRGPLVYSRAVRAGDVASQAPAAGTLLQKGSTVRVEVSKGPAPVAVPTLSGLSEPAAVARLKALGLVVKTASAYSETVTTGYVISYTPDTGVHLPGTVVQVTVSLGPRPRIVPSFGPDTTYAAAASVLDGMRLSPARTTAYSDTVNAGDVVASSPPPGTAVPRGSTVSLTVSLGPHLASVPDVIGDSGATASQVLSNAGFNVQVYGPDPQAGAVVLTNPGAGRTVHYGDTVDVFVL